MKRHLLCIALALPLCVGCTGRDLDAFPQGGSDAGTTDQSGCGATCEAACSAPGIDDPYSTSTDLFAKIVGRWGYCSGANLAVRDTSGAVKGIEILADGRFFMLITGTAGLIRGQGFDYEGTWGPPQPAGGPYSQIDFTFSAGGQVISSVAFRKEPRLVRFVHTAGTVDYALMP